MPYLKGKLKGELTNAELRRLVSAHNKLNKIIIPKGSNRDDIIKLIKDKGYTIDHKNQKIISKTDTVNLPDKAVRKKKEESSTTSTTATATKPKNNTPLKLTDKQKEKFTVKASERAKGNKELKSLFGKTATQILGITARASPEEVKKAYKPFLKFHPDKSGGDKAKEEKFKMGTQAFKLMMDTFKQEKSQPKEEIDKLKGYNKLLKKFNDLYKERLEIQDDYLKGKMTLDEYEDEFVDLGNSILKVFLNNDNNGLDNNLSKDTPSGKILNNGVEKFLESKSEIFKKWKSRTNDKPNKSEQKKSEPKKKDDGVKKYELTFKEQNNILSVIRRIEKGNFNYRKGMGKILNNKILFQSDKKNNLKDLFMSKVKGVRIMFYKRQLAPKLKKIYNIEEPIPKEDEEFNKWFNNAIKND